MSFEADLTALLKTLCPRVYPDIAEAATPLPYVTYQHIGGAPVRYMDGTAPSLRNLLIQINTWAATRREALALSRAIEDALCASSSWIARPESEPVGDVDEDTDRRGCMQDFSFWSSR